MSVFRLLRMPQLPDSCILTDLPLSNHLANWLATRGYERPAELGKLTIGEFVDLPDSPPDAVLHLLCAIEHYVHGPQPPSPPVLPVASDASAPIEPEHHLSLEEELRALVARAWNVHRSTQKERNIRVAVQYFGFDGAGGATLESVGKQHGIRTRERVRQICSRVQRMMKRLALQTPFLDRSVSFASKALPCRADSLESRLQEEGLTSGRFRLEGVIRALHLLTREVPFEIVDFEGVRTVIQSGRIQLAKRAVVLAERVIAHFGVTTINDVTAIVQERISPSLTPEFVAHVLEHRHGFVWLERESGWFWIYPTKKNRVVSRIRKILSVTGEIEVSELRAGIARHYQMKGYSPPRRVLLALCRQLPNCHVENNLVRADPPLRWQDVLRGTEYQMADILISHGPVMQRAKFEEMCRDRGMNRSTFYVYLDYSPILERFASGVYGLRGAIVDPSTIESLLPQSRPTTTVRLDHGWSGNNRIWISYQLSEAMIANGAFSVPPGFKALLQGSFTASVADGQRIGTLVVKETSGWGLGPFFRRRGGESGDLLLLVFDLSAKTVVISIGDQDLLNEQLEPHSDDAH
jgi:hypothetical protein